MSYKSSGYGKAYMNSIPQGECPSGPVRKIPPPATSEPAEKRTLAAILLRRHKDVFVDPGKDSDKRFLFTMWSNSFTRSLTSKEAKRALALLTWYRSR